MKNSILSEQKFWDVLEYFLNLEKQISYDEACTKLNLHAWELNSFLSFLKGVGYELEIESKNDERFLIPPPEQKKITVEFSLLDWLQFQAHFPAVSSEEGKPYHGPVKKKFTKIEEEHSDHDLFEPAGTLEKLLSKRELELVSSEQSLPNREILAFIEESMIDEKVLQLGYQGKTVKVLPRKIVYFDGALNLIGEGVTDSCLMNIKTDIIDNALEEDMSWRPIYSKHEVDDFISSLRLMAGSSIRLVLKIYSRQNFDLNLEHQHFENPCVFSNPDGDHIWAATLEPNDQLFEWLCDLGTDVEILDPTSVKLKFLEYCENKLKKLA